MSDEVKSNYERVELYRQQRIVELLKDGHLNEEQESLLLSLYDNMDGRNEKSTWHEDARDDIKKAFPGLFEQCYACEEVSPTRDGKVCEVEAAVMYDRDMAGHPADHQWVCDGCIDNSDEKDHDG